MALAEFWFLVMWFYFTGYFVLEGFDFGVGALLPVLGKDDTDRRVLINTIGPVWDANETWLIVAGAAMFAAFPAWYATAFSVFYLPLFLILAALIVRGVAFEYRGKVDKVEWRRRWDACIVIGSALPPVLWGVAFADMVNGVPLDRDGNFIGTLLDLLNPYALLGGLTFLGLFVCHGAIFIALRTVGAVRHAARKLASLTGIPVLVLLGIFTVWTSLTNGRSLLLPILTVAGVAAALVANARESEGWAFGFTATSVIGLTAVLFTALWPDVMRASNDPALTITIANASSAPYTLKVMTWVAALATPFVLLYQGWTYWVFRQRIGRDHIPTRPQHGAETEPTPS